MAQQEMQKPKNLASVPSQNFLQVSELREDCIVLKDGTIRAVLAVASTNFDLKSEEEQNAIIYNYQRFLNSLDYPIQILMQSRHMNIGDYIEKLKSFEAKQTNELLRTQTTEYIDFIQRLVENANVMNKSFYVIVPWSGSVNVSTPGIFEKIFGKGEAAQIAKKVEVFEKNKQQLDERVNQLVANLSSVGARVVRLNTNELVELVYSSYNLGLGPELNVGSLPEMQLSE